MPEKHEEDTMETDHSEAPTEGTEESDAEVNQTRERMAGVLPKDPKEIPEDPRDRLSYIEAFNMTCSAPWLGLDDPEDESE